MNHSAALIISCLLLWSNVRAAFRDFIVEPGDEEQFEPNKEVGLGCAMEDSEQLISYQDVEHDGTIDTQLLLTALMQHAQRLGMTLDQLANQVQTIEADALMEAEIGCDTGRSLSYREQPSWYDVFFN